MEVTVFDEHHEAFLFWEENIASGRLNKNAKLLHVDGHSDLAIPPLTVSVYSLDVRKFVQTQLDIGNFIIPAVLRDIFKEVIFLSCSDKPQKRKKYNIGTLYGKGRWINNGFPKNRLTARLYPDAKEWHYSIINDASDVKMECSILDIDLDYFYGYYYSQPQFGLLLTDRQLNYLNKKILSDDKYAINLNPFYVRNRILKPRYLNKFNYIVYNNSKEWIECAIKYFTETLTVKPEIISICRSVKSGYTPKKYARYAEKTLIQYLNGKKGIEYSDIISVFEVYPFITCVDNIIYNPLTNKKIELGKDSYFIWERIRQGKNLRQIFKDMFSEYDIEREKLERETLKFIFRLKRNFIIK